MKVFAMLSVLGLFGWAGARAEDKSPASAQAVAPAPAPQKDPLSSLRAWFKHVRQGLAESSVSGAYQKRNVTAVAAVRGDPQKAAELEAVEWKGSRSAADKVRKAEKRELDIAVALIEDGQIAEGLKALDAFEEAHPKNSFAKELPEIRANAKKFEAALAESEAKGR